jgi:hypothetical protein
MNDLASTGVTDLPTQFRYLSNGAVVGSDGWISSAVDDGTTVHLKVGRHEHRVVVKALVLTGDEITTDTLRSVHPARILSALRGAEIDFGTADDGRHYVLDGDAFLQLSSLSPPPSSPPTVDELAARRPRRPAKAKKRKPLGRPDGTDPDRFYEAVAAAYASAAAETNRVVQVLADENDVPVETVRRWVKEARRRKKLAPGRRGSTL